MKKKVFRSIILILVVVVCTACNGNVTRDIRHAGFNLSNKFVCDSFYPQEKMIPVIKELDILLIVI